MILTYVNTSLQRDWGSRSDIKNILSPLPFHLLWPLIPDLSPLLTHLKIPCLHILLLRIYMYSCYGNYTSILYKSNKEIYRLFLNTRRNVRIQFSSSGLFGGGPGKLTMTRAASWLLLIINSFSLTDVFIRRIFSSWLNEIVNSTFTKQ